MVIDVCNYSGCAESVIGEGRRSDGAWTHIVVMWGGGEEE